MSQHKKIKSKAGRPRKYPKSKERYIVADKKRPRIRCMNPEQQEIFLWIRDNPEVYEQIKTQYYSKNKVVPTISKNDKLLSQQKDIEPLEDDEFGPKRIYINPNDSVKNLEKKLKAVGYVVKSNPTKRGLKGKVTTHNKKYNLEPDV